MSRTTPLTERLAARAEPTTETGCLLWIGKIDTKGYGLITQDGTTRRAHRVAWELHNKQRIPDGMVVCHHCDVRSCINPSHLFVGTQSDNLRDCWNKGRGHLASRKADGSMPKRLTAEVVDAVRALRLSGVTQAATAAAVGISQGAVSGIMNGKPGRSA